jgi:predicted PurR-regulated permease PerM
MKKAVGINPIMSLIVLIIGGKLGGILGVLLSIPVYLIAETIFEEIMKNHTLLQRNE